jgi:tRNA/tmRNA/rRNA uracil-C5-methylase (TrmA/RlmC/RlmD family)
VRIDGLASSGEGVGRLPDGRVVFVEGGVPGDLVEAAEWKEGPRMVRARIGRLIEVSPDRVEPPCSHFGVCGGCLWQQIAYPAQLAAKGRIVRDALERIGGLEIPGGDWGQGQGESAVEIEGSSEPYGYRARVRLVEAEGRLGFRRRGSRAIEAIDACPVLVPALEARRGELAASMGTSSPSSSSSLPSSSPPSRPRRRVVEWVLLAGADGQVAGGPVGAGETSRQQVELSVLGERLRASATSFVQAHEGLRESLAARVVSEACLALGDAAEAHAPTRFADLYAGIGFFTLPLARRGLAGMALESDRAALADLRANLEGAGLADRVEVLGGRVERRKDLAKRLARADVLIVDPPRTGLDRPVREAIAQAAPRRIVYVSCDPATLARDLRFLVETGGYRLSDLRAFDLFPQTPHVETVVRLERVEPETRTETETRTGTGTESRSR